MTAPTVAAAHSVTAQGRIKVLNEAGVLDGSDCVVAARVGRLLGEDPSGDATLALALAIRAVREGSTALALDSVADLSGEPAEDDPGSTADVVTAGSVVRLPEPAAWLDTVRSSRFVAEGVLRVDLGLVYLDRNHVDERLIAAALTARRTQHVTPVDSTAVENAILEQRLDDAQQDAVRRVAERATTVLTGGPGMGKTYTISSVLQALDAGSDHTLRIALAAPTGKAAARLNESLKNLLVRPDSVHPAVTLHRLLGSRAGSSQRFRHDAHNPLPHDVVVVDEASMLSLSLTARLIEALPPTARLLLVGDPDQLASVEAGSVLADLARGLEADGSVVHLTKDHRLHDDRAALAQAFRTGSVEEVLGRLDDATNGVTFIETDQPSLNEVPQAVDHAARLRDLALSGDSSAALDHSSQFRLLCAHRTGPYGTHHWNRLIEQQLADRVPEVSMHPMYVGRPILITRNDYGLGVSNGDTGVIIRTDDGPLAVIESGTGVQRLSAWRLSDVETMHAMTVHKAQGSQADSVVVIVPPLGSRLLTREMLYTAVTRASKDLTIVGLRESIRAAVRAPAQRSSGLAHRLG